jgi:hypothetical protein
MRSLLIALTFFASAALAQTTGTVVLTTQSTDTTIRVSRDSCDTLRTVNWTLTTTATQLCSSLVFWLASGSGTCSDRPDSSAKEVAKLTESQLASTRSGQVQFKVSELPGFKDAVTCPAEGREDAYQMCASIKLPGGTFGTECGSGSYQKGDINIVYDAKPPDAPSIGTVSPLDQALSVRVNVPDDANRVKLLIERVDGTGSRTIEQSSDQTLFSVKNLENDVPYRVTATALDAADNESAASDSQEGTPIHTRGFYDRYVEAGGQEMGGCSAATGSLTGGWVLVALGFWLSSRRNQS